MFRKVPVGSVVGAARNGAEVFVPQEVGFGVVEICSFGGEKALDVGDDAPEEFVTGDEVSET
ncbi:hypothetical protein OHA28_50265 [Streptomyces sp. NBC_00269]|uniref:hypothetical protein n=1 Tax=Streptomyces sp. NBC_00269 TaxID=2975696 RepID=UPI002E2C70E1|nr:hypothetical protein [Streptomyces sp. NBC_00269]